MKKLYLTFFVSLGLCLMLSYAACAMPTTPQQAQQAVTGWLQLDTNPLGEEPGIVIKVTMYGTGGEIFNASEALYYAVFLEPKGVVFVAADDCVEPIIAFLPRVTEYKVVESSPFHKLVIADIIDRVKATRNTLYKTTVAAEVANSNRNKWKLITEANNKNMYTAGLESISNVQVAPLLSSQWSQGSIGHWNGEEWQERYLYNYYTPGHYVSGCTSTAMAQVFRYFQHPKTGIGIKPCTFEVNGVKTSAYTRGGDGQGGPYKWDSMPLIPDEATITDTECQNIGALLSDIGMAIGAHYTSNETAAAFDMQAIENIFQYSNAVFCMNVAGNEWTQIPSNTFNQIVNSNLDAALPVLLSLGGTAGHAVVADGYGYSLSTIYHHINMGWGGYEDAWYATPAISEAFFIIDTCVYNIYPTGTGEIISGKVLDSTGHPLSEAVVSISGSNSFSSSTHTNDNGIFAFTKVPSNTAFALDVTKSGYSFKKRTGVRTTQSTQNSTICGNVWGLVIAEGVDYPVEVEIDLSALQLSNETLTLNAGEAIDVTLASIPEGATFSATGLPAGITLNNNGHLFGASTAEGTYSVTIQAEFDEATDTASFTLRIRSDDTVKVTIDLSNLPLTNKTLKLSKNEAIDMAILSNPAGATFSATGLPTGIAMTIDGHLYGSASKSGFYPVVITAIHNGQTATESFTIRVQDENTATDPDKNSSSGGGGGCNAGWGFLMLGTLVVFLKCKGR